MATRYSSIALVDVANPAYRRHCAQMALYTRSNRGQTRPDERRHLAVLVERIVRMYIARSHALCPGRVLSWRELDSSRRWLQRYRELDAVVRFPSGEIRVVEIKSTWSRIAARDGVVQLKKSMGILAHLPLRVTAHLVLASVDGAAEADRTADDDPMPVCSSRPRRLPADLSVEAPLLHGEIGISRMTAVDLERCAAAVGAASPQALARSQAEGAARLAQEMAPSMRPPEAQCSGPFAEKLRACLGRG